MNLWKLSFIGGDGYSDDFFFISYGDNPPTFAEIINSIQHTKFHEDFVAATWQNGFYLKKFSNGNFGIHYNNSRLFNYISLTKHQAANLDKAT